MEIHTEVVSKLANELAETIRKFREAEWLLEEPTTENIIEYDLSDLSEYVDELIKQSDALKQPEVKLPADAYWRHILVSKIKIIGIIGGFELMQRVHSQLSDIPDPDGYHYASVFDTYADGIGGWMS